jgi:hypothetical protein
MMETLILVSVVSAAVLAMVSGVWVATALIVAVSRVKRLAPSPGDHSLDKTVEPPSPDP